MGTPPALPTLARPRAACHESPRDDVAHQVASPRAAHARGGWRNAARVSAGGSHGGLAPAAVRDAGAYGDACAKSTPLPSVGRRSSDCTCEHTAVGKGGGVSERVARSEGAPRADGGRWAGEQRAGGAELSVRADEAASRVDQTYRVVKGEEQPAHGGEPAHSILTSRGHALEKSTVKTRRQNDATPTHSLTA